MWNDLEFPLHDSGLNFYLSFENFWFYYLLFKNQYSTLIYTSSSDLRLDLVFPDLGPTYLKFELVFTLKRLKLDFDLFLKDLRPNLDLAS